MANNLPEPKSRKESYLAKAAGMSVTIPEAPESRIEQYLAAIAEGGGGGGTSYTAGDGITISDNTISVSAPNEYVDLTVTNISADTITVTPNKTPAQVKAMVDAGDEVVYRLVVPQDVGNFKAGTYLLQTILASSLGVGASAISGDNTNAMSFVFAQAADSNSGTISVKILGGGSGPTVVQTTGTSQTDVMSQNATTSMIWTDPSTKNNISIRGAGSDTSTGTLAVGIGNAMARGTQSVAIGQDARIYAAGSYSVAIGNAAKADGKVRAVALGNSANAAYDNSVAIGTDAVTTAAGQVNIGAGTSGRGYNNTNYRTLAGVHDPVDNHDAATKGYVDGLVGNVAAALNAINNGTAS